MMADLTSPDQTCDGKWDSQGSCGTIWIRRVGPCFKVEGPVAEFEDARQCEEAWKLFVAREYADAFRAYMTLAEQGIPSAQDFVGWMYLGGVGTSIDSERARAWFRKAAASDNAWAQYHLACMALYEDSFEEARELLERAVQQGNLPAIFRLGIMYNFGQGVPTDHEKAKTYFDLAAQHGHLPALRDIAREMIRGERGFWRRFQGILLLVKTALSAARIYWSNPYDKRLGLH